MKIRSTIAVGVTLAAITSAFATGCASRRTTATGGTAPPANVTVKSEAADRLQNATTVFQEIMATPEQAIPEELLARAHCAVVIPGLKKGAFVVGAKYGKGYFTCRDKKKAWTAPASVIVEGGSFGFQIGGSETDVVMLVMNPRGEDRLLSSQFTLGGEASVAAGPVGRTASANTDAYMTAEMLSWSRARGAFAGVALTGATLREDVENNTALYGRALTNRDIIQGNVPIPEAARPFISILTKYSAREQTS